MNNENPVTETPESPKTRLPRFVNKTNAVRVALAATAVAGVAYVVVKTKQGMAVAEELVETVDEAAEVLKSVTD